MNTLQPDTLIKKTLTAATSCLRWKYRPMRRKSGR